MKLNEGNRFRQSIDVAKLGENGFYAVCEVVPANCNVVYENKTAYKSFIIGDATDSTPGSILTANQFTFDSTANALKAATTITNFPNSRLPATGGLGMAEVLPVIGVLILCMTASYALVVRKRK